MPRSWQVLASSVILALVVSCASQAPPTTANSSNQPAPAMRAEHKPEAFSADEVRTAAAAVSFRSVSSMPGEVSDALEYFDTSSTPALKEEGPIVLGVMRVKAQGVRIRGAEQVLPPADYFDWVGKKNGMWVRGYSTADGNTLVASMAHFGEPQPDHRSGFHVYVHDLAQLADLKRIAEGARAQIPGRGGPPLPPPGRDRPPPPRRDTPTPEPRPTPKPSRCVFKCKTLLDLDKNPPQQYNVPDWVEIG